MTGEGLLHVIDLLGATLAATQAENERLRQQVEQMTQQVLMTNQGEPTA